MVMHELPLAKETGQVVTGGDVAAALSLESMPTSPAAQYLPEHVELSIALMGKNNKEPKKPKKEWHLPKPERKKGYQPNLGITHTKITPTPHGPVGSVIYGGNGPVKSN